MTITKFIRSTLLCATLLLVAGFPSLAQAQLGLLQNALPFNQFRNAVMGQPQDDRMARLQAIQQQSAVGNLQEAIRMAEELAERDRQARHPMAAGGNPLLQQSAQMAASLHMRARQYDQAIGYYGIAIDAVSSQMAMANLRAMIGIKLEQAEAHEKKGDIATAKRILEAMLAGVSPDEPAFALERQKINHEIGRLALSSGDLKMAEKHYSAAVRDLIFSVGQSPRTSPVDQSGSVSYSTAMNQFATAMATAMEMARTVNRDQVVTDAQGQLVAPDGGDSTLTNDVMDLRNAFTGLAEVYWRRSDAVSLRKLYENSFRQYAHALELAPTVAGLGRGNVTLERLYARLGAYLAAARLRAQADNAFDHALRLNAARVESAAGMFAPDALAATFAARRDIVSMHLSYALVQRVAEKDLLHRLAGELMQAKGMESAMYAGRSRAAALSENREIRELFQRMEDARAVGNRPESMRLASALHQKMRSMMAPMAFLDGAEYLSQVAARVGSETLISIVGYRSFDFGRQAFGDWHYLGISIDKGIINVRDLGRMADIDSLVSQARSGISAQGKGDKKVQQALYVRLIRPLFGAAMPSGRYVADVDGELNLLPLEVLVDGSGKYLIESGGWRYVNSTRLLTKPAVASGPSGKSLVLVNPDYDASQRSGIADLFGLRQSAQRGMELGPLRSARFAALPDTLEEGRAAAAAIRRMGADTDVLSGTDASLASLQQARSPRFLHIATHGFFLEGAGKSSLNVTDQSGRRLTAESRVTGLSSGLALAGANRTLAQGAGDGILFSSKIRQLDLMGTELAILSACDTGVGEVEVGEGVAGLRLALEVAGARSTVTSLWRVPSAETRDLMISFYDELAKGSAKSAALQQAKLRMMKRHGNPFYWGAFVLTGSD